MKKLKKDSLRKNAVKVIDELGGPSKVAELFDLTPWAVSKWRISGRIPADRIKPLCRVANKARGDGYWTTDKFLEG